MSTPDTPLVGVTVSDPELQQEARALTESLVADRVASRLAAWDATLWGPDAEPEASIRLSWTSLHETSRPLVAEIAGLRAELLGEGVSRVVLAGMGGSSLAPEVICRTEGVDLVVLDTTDPAQVADALAGDLQRTVLVVSSKSGSTLETDSHRRIFSAAFEANGIDPARRIVVVTDPGSGLEATATELGYRRVFTADPHVGGRYSALTAFGLVPSGLAGADVGALLDSAASVAPTLVIDAADNPGLVLAGALGAAHARGAEKVVLADTGSGILGFPDWAEQLVAESTGKNGTGLLPVAVEGPDAAGFAGPGRDATAVAIGAGAASVQVQGGLGAQFLLWETAVAAVGRLLGINPFDQPDVEAAKKAARALLDAPGAGTQPAPLVADGAIEVHVVGDWLTTPVSSVSDAVGALLDAAPEQGYLAVQAYLDRIDDASTAVLRPELARHSGLQTTFGWGPRFLHSTGQYHKGGHQNGVFLQLTGASAQDLDIPGQPFGLATLQLAQAAGDGAVLAEHGRPVLRLHLTDRLAGLSQLAAVVQAMGSR